VVDGQPVPYRTAGAGAPLLLVHGLAGSWRWWERAVPALAERRRVYLVDLPGFGGLRGRRFALGEAPSFLAGFVEALDLGPVDAAGHSLGGVVCARLAVSRPECVRRLVLVAPAAVAGGRPPLIRAAFSLAHTSPSLLRMLAEDAVRCGPLVVWRGSRELLADHDLLAALRLIEAPTLLVWGTRDAFVPPELGPRLEREIPGARLLVMPGVGHVPMYETPAAFARETLAFLDAGPPD
jgi:pimeloyl-ACP methyl ester carboxylesterase